MCRSALPRRPIGEVPTEDEPTVEVLFFPDDPTLEARGGKRHWYCGCDFVNIGCATGPIQYTASNCQGGKSACSGICKTACYDGSLGLTAKRVPRGAKIAGTEQPAPCTYAIH